MPAKQIHFFFDLGGVLFDVNRQRVWQSLSVHSSLSAEEIQTAFVRNGALILYETGQISTEAFLEQLAGLAQVDRPSAELESIWQSALEPIDENLKAVKTLAEAHPVGIISNTNAAHLARIYEQAPFLKNLPASFSHETGFMKPRREIFQHALRQANHSNGLNAFIDDRQDNVTAAERVGFQAMQLSQPNQLTILIHQIFEQ